MERGTQTVSLDLVVADSTVGGTVYLDGATFGTIERGTLRGDTLHFAVDRLDFTGLVAGRRMTLAIVVSNGSTRRVTLTKRPDAPAPPLPPRGG
jgi:hypothetical protein